MIKRLRNLTLFAGILLMSSPALAQFKMGDDSWVDPITGVISDATAGLIRLGLLIAVLGLIGVMSGFAISGRIEWLRVAQIGGAAAFIGVGADMFTQLLT